MSDVRKLNQTISLMAEQIQALTQQNELLREKINELIEVSAYNHDTGRYKVDKVVFEEMPQDEG